MVLRRAVPIPILSLVLSVGPALVGCSDRDADGGAPSGPSSTPATVAGPPSADVPDSASDPLPSSCDLVPAALVRTTLGFDPGRGVVQKSVTGGTDTCVYDTALGSVQSTMTADLYFNADAYDGAEVDGAVDAPAPADRGYVTVGSFLVVKGPVGVFVTLGAVGTSSIQQWTTLAKQVATSLP